MQQQLQSLQNEVDSGKVASNLMSQFINAGMMQQTGENEVVVPSQEGDKVFRAFEG